MPTCGCNADLWVEILEIRNSALTEYHWIKVPSQVKTPR